MRNIGIVSRALADMGGVAFLACVVMAASFVRAGQAEDASAIDRRVAETLAHIQAKPWPDPDKTLSHADAMALLLLFKNEKVAEANRLVLAYCGADRTHSYVGNRVANDRCDSLFRIYLMERTRRLLTPEASKAIEDYALDLLTKYNLGVTTTLATTAGPETLLLPNNGQTNRWRRYSVALQVVRRAERYGPAYKFDGQTLDAHCQAWNRFWIKFFHTFPNEGTDMDVAHPGAYGECTVGVFYDLYDLSDDPEVRRLAGNFLTLFWAEVASEFQPTVGERGGMATSRWPHYEFRQPFWARELLRCYGWHDIPTKDTFLGEVLFLTSGYRPPAIVNAIAHNKDRGCYQATSRRPGLTGGAGVEVTTIKDPLPHERIILDNGNSHYRRDVYYTPDYALGTITTDPQRIYISDIVLTPMMGATFASGEKDRVIVNGTGYYPMRPLNGITGKAVSIIARDPNAKFGRGRFLSDGTRVFISNGQLWDNRVEDPSGWFFTRANGAYVALRPADQGYHPTDNTYIWADREAVNRTMVEVKEKDGHFLELNDLWAPIVLQMGRTADYASFETFQKSVKGRQFEYGNGKLSYVSEAGDRYEVWAHGTQPPKINGSAVNLDPAKTYDTPFLSMEHGSNKAVIKFPGFDDVTLEF